MNKMKFALFIIVMTSCFMMEPLQSYGLEAIDHDETGELAKTWNIFLEAVAANDLKKLRNMSVERIRCLSCLDNTELEEREIEKFKANDPDWYEKLYAEKIYIPVDTFYREDYPLIFTKQFIRILKDRTARYSAESFHGLKIYGVIIATLKPGELSPGHEGCLYIFQFVRAEKEYKFWGIDTIP